MKLTTHRTAKPSHYDGEAENYDKFTENHSRLMNQLIEKILKKHRVKSVLDLTCGTGSQVFWLLKRDYEVVGSDFNSKMLNIAKAKARKANIDVKLQKGDMRTVNLGKFDAAITIFNAVGHLTKKDFEKSMRNIHRNLKNGGLYIFDIYNLDYLLANDQITKLTIDWQKTDGKKKIRYIQYSTIDADGILASYTTSLKQISTHKAKISKDAQTLQVYSVQQLKEMLERSGYKVIRQCGIDGKKVSKTKTERIITIAKRLSP